MAEPLTHAHTHAARNTPAFEQWPEICRLENDFFCHACGYNLCLQAVRREPTTEVLLARCPECGTFHPVAAPAASLSRWGQRFKGLLMLYWIALVLSVAFLAGILHGVAIYFTLDEFTGFYNYQTRAYLIDFNPFYWQHPHMWWLVCGISGCSSFGLAFVGTVLAVVFLPHWKRVAHVAVLMTWAVVPAMLSALAFWMDIPDGNTPSAETLMTWAVPYLSAYVLCYLAGGALALLIGRGLVRLVVRITVPPRWRVYLEAIRPQ